MIYGICIIRRLLLAGAKNVEKQIAIIERLLGASLDFLCRSSRLSLSYYSEIARAVINEYSKIANEVSRATIRKLRGSLINQSQVQV